MWPDIMARVCGCEPSALRSEPAWLDGHVRRPVLGQDYPGLVAVSGKASVQGVLYRGLKAAEFQRLDAFEGQEYERVVVEVSVGASKAGEVPMERAWVYRFRSGFIHRLGPGDWSPQEFETQGKARFCQRYVGFVQTPAP